MGDSVFVRELRRRAMRPQGVSTNEIAAAQSLYDDASNRYVSALARVEAQRRAQEARRRAYDEAMRLYKERTQGTAPTRANAQRLAQGEAPVSLRTTLLKDRIDPQTTMDNAFRRAVEDANYGRMQDLGGKIAEAPAWTSASEATLSGLSPMRGLANLGASMMVPVDIAESALDAARGVTSPSRFEQSRNGLLQLMGQESIPTRDPSRYDKFELTADFLNPLNFLGAAIPKRPPVVPRMPSAFMREINPQPRLPAPRAQLSGPVEISGEIPIPEPTAPRFNSRKPGMPWLDEARSAELTRINNVLDDIMSPIPPKEQTNILSPWGAWMKDIPVEYKTGGWV